MGLGHFLEGVGKAAENTINAGAWALDPHHYDDIAHGVGRTAEFVAENPGVVAHIGKEIIKSQVLDPKMAAVNIGLIGLSFAGGAGGAAFAARMGMAARTAAVGVKAAEAGRAIKIGEEAVQAGKIAQEAVEGVAQAGRIGRAMGKINEVRSFASPISTRTAAFRTSMGEKVLAGAEGEASMGRQMFANAVQGTGGIGKPARMVGQSEQAYKAQVMTRYARMGQGVQGTAQSAPGVVEAVANPRKAIVKGALQAGKAKYGDQFGEPTGDVYQTTSGGQAVLPGSEGVGAESATSPMYAGSVSSAGGGAPTAARMAPSSQPSVEAGIGGYRETQVEHPMGQGVVQKPIDQPSGQSSLYTMPSSTMGHGQRGQQSGRNKAFSSYPPLAQPARPKQLLGI